MIKADLLYKANLRRITTEGCLDRDPRPRYKDSTPAHSRFITGVFEEYDISMGEFPIPTLRPTAVKTAISEVLWIYQKQTSSLEVARAMGVKWWGEWDIGNDTIGQRYGATIARYDLMNKLLDGLAKDPFGRRHNINMFQYADLAETPGLFPCAFETLYSVRDTTDGLVLDMTLIQRSNDYIVAGYINKIQYTALLMMIAGHCGYKAGMFRHLVQNLHVYDRHSDAVQEILDREPLNKQPFMVMSGNKNFYDYTVNDFEVLGTEGITKLESKLELAI
jgi:thymidylate synthase